MEDLELYAYTSDEGEFFIQNRNLLDEFCKRFPGKKWLLKIVRRSAKRSLPQNAYYHGVVVQTIRLGLLDIGYQMTHDEVHYFLKQKFNSINIPNQDGEAIEVPKSTATLNKVEFSEYIERIAQWASTYLNVVIPPASTELKLL